MARNPDKISHGEEQYYMSEGCPHLALAFNEVFEYPIMMLIDEATEEEYGGKYYPLSAHVFVETPERRHLDIKGERSIESIKKDFYDLEEPKIIEISREELKSDWMGDFKPFFSYDSSEEKLAKNLILKIIPIQSAKICKKVGGIWNHKTKICK